MRNSKNKPGYCTKQHHSSTVLTAGMLWPQCWIKILYENHSCSTVTSCVAARLATTAWCSTHCWQHNPAAAVCATKWEDSSALKEKAAPSKNILMQQREKISGVISFCFSQNKLQWLVHCTVNNTEPLGTLCIHKAVLELQMRSPAPTAIN
jgi:hypothetical protein